MVNFYCVIVWQNKFSYFTTSELCLLRISELVVVVCFIQIQRGLSAGGGL